MLQKRYSLSFFIASFVYCSLLFFFFYQETIHIKQEKSTNNTPILFSIVEPKKIIPQPEVIQQPIVEQKIVKQEPKKIEKPLEKIVKKTIKKPVEKTITMTQNLPLPTLSQKTIQKPQTLVTIDKETLKAKQNHYYETIKQTIDKNKSYPKVALRRGIQGEVKIEFTLTKNGELLSYKIIDGDKIFENSITQAIASSFPITPPKDIFTSNLDLKLTLLYKIY